MAVATGSIPYLIQQLQGQPTSVESAPSTALNLGEKGVTSLLAQSSGKATPTGPLMGIDTKAPASTAPVGAPGAAGLGQPGSAQVTQPLPQSGNGPSGESGPVPGAVADKFSYPPNMGEPLTYQQVMNRSLGPIINQYAQQTGPAAVSAALAPYGNTGTVAEGIASTLQTMTSDYQSGLQTMLKYSGEQTPLQAILKGESELIAYPVAGLVGQQGAPPGVETSSLLQNLYATLNQQRNNVSLNPSNAANSSGYANPNAVNSLLANTP